MSTIDYTTPDPELAALYAKRPPPPERPTERPVAASREAYEKFLIPLVHASQRPLLPPESAYVVENHEVVYEGGTVRVRSYRPADNNQTYPLMLWLHGGGWGVGNLELDDLYMRICCVEFNACMVSVDYRLAPEHPFPTGLNDSYASLKWSIVNASTLHVNSAKGVLLVSISAGANFAAVMTHRALTDPFFTEGHKITGQVLQLPVVLHPDVVPEQYKDRMRSYSEPECAQGMNIAQARNCYTRYGGPPADPEVSPFLRESLKGLPPAFLQVCGRDLLRDEGILYAERLAAADVPTKCEVYPGGLHGFHVEYSQTALARKFEQDFKDGVKWLLSLHAGSRVDP